MTPSEEFKLRNTRAAAALKVGGFRPTLSPLASNFCRAPVGLANETWPELESTPLAFVCQINLTDAPAVPDLLKDIALLTFFIVPEDYELGRENGDRWVLRTYKSLDGLVPLAVPSNAPKLGKAFECAWEKIEDHPNYDDPEIIEVSPAQVLLEKVSKTSRAARSARLRQLDSIRAMVGISFSSRPRQNFVFRSIVKKRRSWLGEMRARYTLLAAQPAETKSSGFLIGNVSNTRRVILN